MSDEIIAARAREEAIVSYVSEKTDASEPLKSRTKKSKLKKRLPLLVIVGALLSIVALIFVSQSMMPFAIVNRFIEEFNTIGVSSTLRSDNILDLQLSSAGSALELSETQRTSFKSSYVLPVDITVGGAHATALVFKDYNNKFTAVVPKTVLETASAGDINSTIASALSDKTYSPENSPISTETALNTNAFKEKYASASKLWRGGNSGWYDSITNLTEARLAITRTRYNNWATMAVSGAHKAWEKLASGKYKVSDSGVSSYGTYVDVDENGIESTSRVSGSVDGDSLTAQTTADGVRKVLNSKIMSVAQAAATVGCAGVDILTAIHTVMSAQQSMQYLNLATGYFEAVQSAQMGANDGKPMLEYNDSFTRRDSETGKTAMEAAGITSLFSGTNISGSDESVKTTNFENLMSSLGTLSGNISFTAKAFEACSYIRMGVAATNFASTILSFVPILGQATSAIHIVAKVVGRIALGVSIAAITSFIIPKILNQVVANVTKNVATEWFGEDLGNALSSGANKYLGGNFQTGGGSTASKETFAAYVRRRDEVLAEEAELERRTLSPFDVSSEHTFLGNIVYSLIPFASSSSLGGLTKSFGNVLKGSLVSILPSASAIAETDLVQSIGNCPLLESVGIVGDAYCNPYYISDYSTLSGTPAEIEAKVEKLSSNNFSGTSGNGQRIVSINSNLGKYARFCGQRNSQFGVADANIASQIVSQPSSWLSSVPLVGDVAQIITAIGEAENIPWISGSACVASSENPLWEENQYYQRYIEDQRLFESAGIINKSSVAVALEDYYENNPLDNSYEGILARFSGMTKDDVIATLDYIDALEFIASYNPSERTVFGAENLSDAQATYAIIEPCQAKRSCVMPNPLLSKTAETPNFREVLTMLATPKALS